jgi:hypothetical protein|tara:strand:+ start:1721 stop:1837 length:117 start_codon:yes stop_codon:yes gene_type:complete
VLPQVNAETKLQDKAIEALLLAEAVKKSQQPADEPKEI